MEEEDLVSGLGPSERLRSDHVLEVDVVAHRAGRPKLSPRLESYIS